MALIIFCGLDELRAEPRRGRATGDDGTLTAEQLAALASVATRAALAQVE